MHIHTKREADIHRHRERQADRHTKREVDRQTYKERGRQTDMQRQADRHTKRERQTLRQTYKERSRPTDIQREREADMEATAAYISVTSVVSVAVPLAPLTAVVTPDALPLLVGGATVTGARALAP